MPTLSDVTEECPSCVDYIDDMSSMYKSRWLDVFTGYKPNSTALEKMKEYSKDYEFVVLFADWCGDARKAVPALAKLEVELEIKIRALGGMTKPGFGFYSCRLGRARSKRLYLLKSFAKSSPSRD